MRHRSGIYEASISIVNLNEQTEQSMRVEFRASSVIDAILAAHAWGHERTAAMQSFTQVPLFLGCVKVHEWDPPVPREDGYIGAARSAFHLWEWKFDTGGDEPTRETLKHRLKRRVRA